MLIKNLIILALTTTFYAVGSKTPLLTIDLKRGSKTKPLELLKGQHRNGGIDSGNVAVNLASTSQDD